MFWICSSSCQRNHRFSSEYGNALHSKQHLLLFCRPEKTLHTQITTVSIFLLNISVSFNYFFSKNIKKISYLTMSKKEREKAILHWSFLILFHYEFLMGSVQYFWKKSKQPTNNNKLREEQKKMGDTMKIIWFLCSFCIHSAQEKGQKDKSFNLAL